MQGKPLLCVLRIDISHIAAPRMAFEDLASQTLFRYFHILSGVTWIGLLYFFNLVNLPLLKFPMKKPFDVNMSEKATANITLKTLFWFRWGAMFTFIFGLLLIESVRTGLGMSFGEYFFDNGPQGLLILLGVILGTIMWFNVWFIIWPNQQVILSNNKEIAAGVSDDKKAKLTADNAPRVKNAVMASRFNTWASVPMLFGMVFGAHGAGSQDWSAYQLPVVSLVVVLLVMVYFSNKK